MKSEATDTAPASTPKPATFGTDPNSTFTRTIRDDLPESERPVFEYYYMTIGEGKRAKQVFDGIPTMTGDEAFEKISGCVVAQLAGWKNFRNRRGDEVLYDPDGDVSQALDDNLTDAELFRLFVLMSTATSADLQPVQEVKPEETDLDTSEAPDTTETETKTGGDSVEVGATD